MKNIITSAMLGALLMVSSVAGAAAPAPGETYVYSVSNGYNKLTLGKAQYRVENVDGGRIVVLHRLLFIFPAVIDNLEASFIGPSDDAAGLDGSSHPEIRKTPAPMIAALVRIHLRIAPEFGSEENDRFIQHCFARLMTGMLRKILNHAGQSPIEDRATVVYR